MGMTVYALKGLFSLHINDISCEPCNTPRGESAGTIITSFRNKERSPREVTESLLEPEADPRFLDLSPET